MKKVLCRELGPPERLTVAECAPPSLAAGQVRIAVHACGVNFPDTLIVQGLYQWRPDLPFTPGGEVAGVVSEIAPDVSSFAVGDRVVAITIWGGFSEEVVVDTTHVTRMTPSMSMVQAAGFTMTYATSFHALDYRARLQPGETLLVLGAAGGVGITAVELGKRMGARVIAAASTAEKRCAALAQGADEVIDYTTEDLKLRVKELTDGRGADVVYDPVGGTMTEQALRATAWEGRLLIVGFASGDIPQIRANLVLLKGCQVVGIYWGAYLRRDHARHEQDMETLMNWFAAGELKPLVSETFPLEEVAQALHRIERREVIGKIVLTTDHWKASTES